MTLSPRIVPTAKDCAVRKPLLCWQRKLDRSSTPMLLRFCPYHGQPGAGKNDDCVCGGIPMTRFRRGEIMNRIWSVATMMSLLVCVACSRNTSPILSPQLAGLWSTDDPRYQQRFVELSPAFVIIITGPGDPISVQLIDKVRSEPQAESTAFTVFSTDYSQNEQYQILLHFSPANGGELRFGNERLVWKR